MAKATRSRLTEVRVRTATAGDTKHGRQLFDGLGSNGLYLHVTPAGAKCWVQQLMVPNAATGKSRRVRIGLGAWPRVTLAEARKAAFANRCMRDEGRDPPAAKRQRAHGAAKEARVPTFAGAIDEVIALRRPTWKDADTLAGQFRASLERYACALGPIQVSRIATADVMQVLAPHWHSVPAAADTTRRRISTVLQWAIGQGYRSDDPAAKRAVAAALGAQTHRTEHHRAMPYAEVAQAVAAVHARSRRSLPALAIELMVLTATRSNEARGATWSEIDLDARTWTIPAGRMDAAGDQWLHAGTTSMDPMSARISAAWTEKPGARQLNCWLDGCLPENGLLGRYRTRAQAMMQAAGLACERPKVGEILLANADAEFAGAIRFDTKRTRSTAQPSGYERLTEPEIGRRLDEADRVARGGLGRGTKLPDGPEGIALSGMRGKIDLTMLEDGSWSAA